VRKTLFSAWIAGLLAVGPCLGSSRLIDAAYSHQTAYVCPDELVDGLQDFFQPTLEANRKTFQGELGWVKAFGAGTKYPQVWLRDSATVLPASRYFYSKEHLVSWIEEHMAHQRDNGELSDWVAAGAAAHFLAWAPHARNVYESSAVVVSADKNTAEADQEASAVLAVAQAFFITGDRAWLMKPIKGVALLERCERALGFLLRERGEGEEGLITSAFTADWGDVSPLYPDQRAIYLDPKTPLVMGLYTNALFYEAAALLDGIYRTVGDPRAGRWQGVADRVKAGVNRRLWQERLGFYKMHALIRGASSWDDSSSFAMGGNSLAALYGLASRAQAARIFKIGESRRKEFGISTIAGALLPPFPEGFFKHPALAKPYSYQNGGQWDWFAGRLVQAEFEQGHSALAYEHLHQIALKARNNRGLYEWHTREGAGQGSANYAGSAGSLAGAVICGLFGIDLGHDALNVTVRLGEKPGAIHLYEPSTDTFVAYRYRYDAVQGIDLAYQSNHPARGQIKVLLPKGSLLGEVRLDGERREALLSRVGEETYLTLQTSWRSHRLEVSFQHKGGGH